jgi:addiction module RelE/StbE family toxin
MEILYKPTFIRELKKLSPALQEEVIEKLVQFSSGQHEQSLKIHKLQGKLSGCYSFSVNYAFRVVFHYGKSKKNAVMLTVGDHSVYQ